MVVKHASLHTGVPSAAPAPLAGARGIGASGERDEMDDSVETRRTGKAGALLRALRPAVPAVISAAAMIFLFAAVMPLSWVAGISWNLYLDRLSDLDRKSTRLNSSH